MCSLLPRPCRVRRNLLYGNVIAHVRWATRGGAGGDEGDAGDNRAGPKYIAGSAKNLTTHRPARQSFDVNRSWDGGWGDLRSSSTVFIRLDGIVNRTKGNHSGLTNNGRSGTSGARLSAASRWMKPFIYLSLVPPSFLDGRWRIEKVPISRALLDFLSY